VDFHTTRARHRGRRRGRSTTGRERGARGGCLGVWVSAARARRQSPPPPSVTREKGGAGTGVVVRTSSVAHRRRTYVLGRVAPHVGGGRESSSASQARRGGMDRAMMAPSCTSGASTRASTTGQMGQQRQLRRGRGCLDERNLTRGRTKVHGGWGRRRREVRQRQRNATASTRCMTTVKYHDASAMGWIT
jgi:hypothetical protein